MMKKILFIALFMPYVSGAQVIRTFAGNGAASSIGDGGAATAASINGPSGIAFDAAGNAYIADYNGNMIRKVSTSGVITTFAGIGGSTGYSGDGGPATAAQFNKPNKLVFDTSGNLYVADVYNNRVRKITPSGTITTFAGNGMGSSGGDGGAATAASIFHPTGMAFDRAGNMYIADYSGRRIRKVTPAGIITTAAGTGVGGYSGDGGPATAAQIFQTYGVATDTLDNLYLADASNNVVRKVSTLGIITTIAGTNVAGYSGDGGAATAAQLNNPAGIAVGISGDIYVADQFNNRVRKISPAGIISTAVGMGTAGFAGDGGAATAAQINWANEIGFDNAHNLYVCDGSNNRVRWLNPGILGVQQVSGGGLNIFPNPAKDKITIELLNSTHAHLIQLINGAGQLISEQNTNRNRVDVSLSDLPVGIYILRVQTGNEVLYREVLKN